MNNSDPDPTEVLISAAINAVLTETKTDKTTFASRIGMPRLSLMHRLAHRSPWRVRDITTISHAFGCHPTDLLHGSAHAITAITRNGRLRNPPK